METNRLMKNGLLISVLIMFCMIFSSCDAPRMNIAKGRVCKTLSSTESKGWSVDGLTDGEKGGKGWSSKAYSQHANRSLYPEYIVVDLGASYAIEKVSLFPRGDGEMAGKGFPEDFSIQVSLEGEPWREIVKRNAYPVPSDGEAQTFRMKKSEGRYVKIEASRFHVADSGRYYFQLSELEVFGKKLADVSITASANQVEKVVKSVGGLRCEHEEGPVGIDVAHPRLSWLIESGERGVMQEAYEILVATDEALLEDGVGDVWSSGRTESEQSTWVEYQGKPLQSGKPYWWKVKVYDNMGKEYAWSQPASFTTGKMTQADWKGIWIGANGDTEHGSVYLRREIEVSKEVKRAMVYFCGLGFSELRIDGQQIGDYVMGPGFTSYNKRTQYLAFDVTKQLSVQGQKALGVTLVDGWYGLKTDPWVHKYEKNVYVDKPKLLLDLHIEYSDGTEVVITSDENWTWSRGTVSYSGIDQENIDLRRAKPGWDRSGFDDKEWDPVKTVTGPEGVLVHQREPLCRIIEEIHPEKMSYDQETDTYKFSFISEVAGVVRFRTRGEKGQVITVSTIPSDLAYPHDNRFILNGGNDFEVYDPRFYNIAIKQVAIKGTTHVPKLEDVTVRTISSMGEAAGSFSCSDDYVNYLEDMVRQTMTYYTTFLPNDPSREWKAWTEDILNMFRSNTYLFKDAQGMYERWQHDLIADQRADGNAPNISPGAGYDDYNSPWWGGMIVWLPWNLYQYYGDESILRASYPSMKRYVDFLTSVSEDGLQDWGLLDWLPIEETPRRIINTPAHFLYANVVSITAEMMGKPVDAEEYAELAESIKKAFNEKFLDPETGIYGQEGWEIIEGYPGGSENGIVPHEIWWTGDRVPTQAGQTLPLAVGLVPEEVVPLVEKALLSEIEAHANHLSTGFCSTHSMLKLLADLAPEIGWEMTTKREYPSWYGNTVGSDFYLLKEKWFGGQVFMPSCAGNIVGWIYPSLGGIRPGSPGYKEIIIKPNMVGDLHWVNSSYHSVHGEIVSNWQKQGKQVIMNITIPCNTTATVYIPTEDAVNITESGDPVGTVEGLKFLGMENNAALYEVGSGTYNFQSVVQH